MDTSIVDYILDLAEATRHHEQFHLGVSPRGALALTQACQAAAVVSGRDYVTPDDVKTLFIPCCASGDEQDVFAQRRRGRHEPGASNDIGPNPRAAVTR